MAKTRLDDKAIKALKMALRTKLGVSKPKAKAKPKREEAEEADDEPAPRAKKAERLGYADL